MKICSSCGENKLLEEYYNHKKFKDGKKRQCKACEKITGNKRYARIKAEGGTYIKNKKSSVRKWNYKNNFGITVEQYEELLENQNHSCAICQKHITEQKETFHIDHSHSDSEYVPKGMIRGLLCRPCNSFLISSNTDPALYERAAEYLKQHTGLKVPEGRERDRSDRKNSSGNSRSTRSSGPLE